MHIDRLLNFVEQEALSEEVVSGYQRCSCSNNPNSCESCSCVISTEIPVFAFKWQMCSLTWFKRKQTSVIRWIFIGTRKCDYSSEEHGKMQIFIVYRSRQWFKIDSSSFSVLLSWIVHSCLICLHSFASVEGALNLSFEPSLKLQDVERENKGVANGMYKPPDCIARESVAILIPHRSREQHLLYLMHHLHPFLQRQQLHYAIYVIQQVGLCLTHAGFPAQIV